MHVLYDLTSSAETAWENFSTDIFSRDIYYFYPFWGHFPHQAVDATI